MARRTPQTFEKRQRERRKEQKRNEKMEKRLIRNEEKRIAKQEGRIDGAPIADRSEYEQGPDSEPL